MLIRESHFAPTFEIETVNRQYKVLNALGRIDVPTPIWRVHTITLNKLECLQVRTRPNERISSGRNYDRRDLREFAFVKGFS